MALQKLFLKFTLTKEKHICGTQAPAFLNELIYS